MELREVHTMREGGAMFITSITKRIEAPANTFHIGSTNRPTLKKSAKAIKKQKQAFRSKEKQTLPSTWVGLGPKSLSGGIN